MKLLFVKKCFAIVSVLFLYTLMGTPTLYAQGGILKPVPQGVQLRIDEPFVARERIVELDASQIMTATNLELNLFSDVTLAVDRTELQQNASGSLTWLGQVAGDEDSSVILIIDGKSVVGNIEADGGHYQIRNAGDTTYSVAEIDQSKYPVAAEPLEPTFTPIEVDEAPDNTAPDDGTIIDVMILYTENAVNGTLSEGMSMDDLIDLAILETNRAYQHSGVIHRLNLVHKAQVDYVESNRSYSEHLAFLTGKNDKEIDFIHDLRDQHKADIVSLIVNDNDYCGIAYVMKIPSHQFESKAFNVVSHRCATGYYSFGHEIGHNLGLKHDRAHSSSMPAYPFGFGYQAPDQKFRTIMAYNCADKCPRVQRFSNPHVNYNNQPTGVDHATTPDNSADNVLAMNNVRVIAANWRGSDNGPCSGITQIPRSECEALVDFYNGTNGPSWTDNSDWLVTNQPCSWFGVTCADGSVTRLQFNDRSHDTGNGLQGTIPASIVQLTNLQSLLLDFNDVGPIPSYIGGLKNLLWLTMSGNQLQSVPPEIGDLTSLIGLALPFNELKTLPPEIGKLTKLTQLNLINNQLETLPPEIGKLVNLDVIYMENNRLSTLPSEIGDLEKLQGLRMYNNQLVSLPSEIGNLSNLGWARFDGNQLSSLPAEIGNLSELIAIRLEDNQLKSLPSEIGKLMNLAELTLRNNQLGTLPSEIGNLAKLNYLDIGSNQLSGPILPEIGDLTSLEHLHLYSNQLSGPIPPEIGNLISLKNLQLEYNQLSGPIPPEIGNLTSLEYLHLEYNQLSGSIPLEIGALTEISHLVLAANQLSGSVPPEIGNLTRLDRMYLHNNQLSGFIPDEFGSLNPAIFYFNNTQLCLPDTLTEWFNNIPDKKGTPSCSEVGPNLAISKSSSAQITGTGVYTLSVTNMGTVSPEDSTWVLDSLPEGVKPISITVDSDWSCTVEEQDVECEYEQPFPANQIHQIVIIVEVTAESATTVENCAIVEIEDDMNYDNNESCVQTVIKPKLEPQIYVSPIKNGRVDDIKFKDEDILLFDPSTNSWNIYFDGSDVKLQKLDINAFHILESGNILMSLNKPVTLDGVRYDDSDILLFTAKTLGSKTSGTFSMYFDGSDVQLTKSGEDIDAITLAPNGELVISTLGNGNVDFGFKDDDLLRFEATSMGDNTSGTWHHYFDGSDIGLTTGAEDISAIWIDQRTEEIHFNTLGNFNINSLGTTLKGDNEDIVICSLVPNAQGNTDCRFDRFWDGDDHSFNGKNIDGYSVQPYASRRAGPNPIFSTSGDLADDEADNELDGLDIQDDDVLDEEDIKSRVYLPVVNR